MLGLALVGWRFGGQRLAATLPFAWAAYPFTQYASSSNTNDTILPALLIFGFFFAAQPALRGGFAALAGWTKFAALVVAPLWATYPEWNTRRVARYVVGYLVGSALAFSVLLLEPNVLDAARTFWDRTLGWQLGRESPFSIWDWGQYHARGIPDLHLPHQFVKALLLAGALAARVRPAPEVAVAARGADRGVDRRVRARADALVLPLPPVVLPLRDLRAARP